jgi:TRAP-type C4-dicarboxylate transport system substrate-binding protein
MKKFYTTVAVCLMFTLLFTFGAVDQAQAQKVIKVKMVGTLPVGHHLTDALYVFKKYVEEKSGGRLFIELYPSQQLYNDKDLVSVVPKGNVDMCLANMDMWTGLVPAVGFFYMPQLFDDENHFFRVAHGDAGYLVNWSLEKVRCKGLGWLNYGTGDLLFKERVTKMEDFQGKRVRSFGQMISYYLQGLGAAPVMMSSGEMYDALQKGTIDGVMSGVTSMRSRKLFEVAKFVPDASVQPVVPFMTIANLRFWNSLPKDLQQIIQDGANEIERYTRTEAKKDVMQSRQLMMKNGVKFQKVSAAEVAKWRKAAIPLMKQHFIENFDPKLAERMFKSLEDERAKVQPKKKK